MTPAIFSFSGTQQERVAVAVHGYERRPSGEYYDDNWLNVEVSVEAGAFKGRYSASFLTGELESFRDQLGELVKSLSGSARLETMETQLSLELVGNGRGGIALKGEAWDKPGIGNRLHFGFNLDQTQAAEALRAMDATTKQYPVRKG